MAQREEFLAKIERGIFSTFFSFRVERPWPRWKAVMWTLQAIQFLVIVVAIPNVFWKTEYVSIPLYALTFSFGQLSPTTAYVSFGVCAGFIALFWATAVIVGIMFKNNDIVIWPLRFLRCGNFLFSWILMVPMLGSLVDILDCRYTSGGAVVHDLFPDVMCWALPHAIPSAIALLALVFFLFFCAGSALFIFPSSGFDSRSRGRYDLLVVTCKVLIVCADRVLTSHAVLRAVCLLTTTTCMLLVLLWMLPYHTRLANMLYAGEYWVCFLAALEWSILNLALPQYADGWVPFVILVGICLLTTPALWADCLAPRRAPARQHHVCSGSWPCRPAAPVVAAPAPSAAPLAAPVLSPNGIPAGGFVAQRLREWRDRADRAAMQNQRDRVSLVTLPAALTSSSADLVAASAAGIRCDEPSGSPLDSSFSQQPLVLSPPPPSIQSPLSPPPPLAIPPPPPPPGPLSIPPSVSAPYAGFVAMMGLPAPEAVVGRCRWALSVEWATRFIYWKEAANCVPLMNFVEAIYVKGLARFPESHGLLLNYAEFTQCWGLGARGLCTTHPFILAHLCSNDGGSGVVQRFQHNTSSAIVTYRRAGALAGTSMDTRFLIYMAERSYETARPSIPACPLACPPTCLPALFGSDLKSFSLWAWRHAGG
ncbi:hypothetical protein PAPYR_3740 [Paratrimastix pyriformis]|uniref:Uncharacterized protein n=1 Tax=Paratrimastix pyriformis TaxID=342808 RepID=A0ABQ8UR47_9EUKA|nr:hypothetical protein PAPYR_3740 [Paratrimastix pyriformis]